MFTTPCFIRKNTPELRKQLQAIGIIPYVNEDMEAITAHVHITGCVLCTYGENGRAYGAWKEHLDFHKQSSVKLIDCGVNEGLFLALAAMNNENDREQWFVEEGRMFKCTSDKINNYSYHWITTRKATAQEIVEYFKTK